ncbi:DUF6428 family protein [Jannaschia sp. LMIT008]|uniref:DUF6428 family protein n=1 Tax=Jannaschia maritima TaxID=3032585 RepID=UPI002811A894|nr:DUF6428 family protein [Jannaschia sp. LMIT008]
MITPVELIAALTGAPALPVRIVVDGHALRAGYHVTEVKLARYASLDCGRGLHHWEEAVVEILDGCGGDPMTAAKLSGIVAEAVDRMPALAEAPLVVEHGTRGVMRYGVALMRDVDGWTMHLQPLRATCKAANAPAPKRSACCSG